MEQQGGRTVMVVDSHVAVRQMLGRVLPAGFQLVAEAGDPAEAFAILRHRQPSLIVLDAIFASAPSIALIRHVKEHYRATRTIVFTGSTDEELLRDVLRQRPDGFVHTTDALPVLEATIEGVARGGNMLSAFATKLQQKGPAEVQRPWEFLSARDIQVIQMVATGKTCKEISVALDLSPKSVEHYRSRVMQKFGLRDAVATTHFAIAHGLVRILPDPWSPLRVESL